MAAFVTCVWAQTSCCVCILKCPSLPFKQNTHTLTHSHTHTHTHPSSHTYTHSQILIQTHIHKHSHSQSYHITFTLSVSQYALQGENCKYYSQMAVNSKEGKKVELGNCLMPSSKKTYIQVPCLFQFARDKSNHSKHKSCNEKLRVLRDQHFKTL